jgi:endonuclease/exonuclease/phosphatase family metal-dependent hydrolase
MKVASYNIHKAIGLDRRRDPERILTILHEIGADIVALQEADRRFGTRSSCLPLAMIDDHGHYRAVRLDTRPDSIGWHGNAFLVARHIDVTEAAVVALPTLEPRGAIRLDAMVRGHCVRVVGMHLDLSGIRRRQQIATILAHLNDCAPPCPTILMGDLNEWSAAGGALRAFAPRYRVLAPGRSFHTRRPVAQLDRIIVSHDLVVDGCGVHHSALASRGSDHLPVWAQLSLPGLA